MINELKACPFCAGKAIIDSSQSGRIGSTKVGYLYGSGPAGQDKQPIVGCMPGKLHEDVDLVMFNHPGCRLVFQSTDVSVVVELRFQSFGGFVRYFNITITVNFHRLMVVAVQKRLKEIRYRVVTKIR